MVKFGTKEYVKWVCNPENSMNCEECPHNKDMDDWQGRFPCGQHTCWVDAHVNREEG